MTDLDLTTLNHPLILSLIDETDSLVSLTSKLCDDFQSLNNSLNDKLPSSESSYVFPRVHKSTPTSFSIDWQYMNFFGGRGGTSSKGNIMRLKVNASGNYNIPDLKAKAHVSRHDMIVALESKFVEIRKIKKQLNNASLSIRQYCKFLDKLSHDPIFESDLSDFDLI